MGERIALFDADMQLGAIIDTEPLRALGPVGGGPNARAELTQFLELMPDAVFGLSSYELTRAWLQFWESEFAPLYAEPEPGDTGPLVEPSDSGDASERLAAAEATASAGEPPAPAPADADMEADQGETPAVATGTTPSPPAEQTPEPEVAPPSGPCFNCNGSGRVAGATEGSVVVCNLCKGTGKLPAPEAVA